MKVVISGSRDIKDENIVFSFLDRSPFEITELVSGGARGVDQICEQWAFQHKIPVKQYKPDYHNQSPNIAPLLRNIEMAEYGDALLAVWKDESRGTKHMIDQIQKRNKPYRIIELRGDEVVWEWGDAFHG
jgi:hypothetical protein